MAKGSVWTIGEAKDGKIKDVSLELLARGRALADELETELVSVLISGPIEKENLQELIGRGADRVISISDEKLEAFLVGNYSNILVDLIKEREPEIILAAATTTGRTLMPYVSTRIHTGLTADCTELAIDPETKNLLQTRPAIGGNIMATIKTANHRPQMATVRPKSSRPLEKDANREGTIENIPFKTEQLDERVRRIGERASGTDEQNIQEADVVVAGGRGMKRVQNFTMLSELAKSLGGVVGASRDAVDRGWAKYPQQIGLSGKTITPKLYIGVGVSGAIQHLAGMKTADTVVAINSDQDAAIFHVSDFGIVGDLFEILPRLNQRIGELRGEKEENDNEI